MKRYAILLFVSAACACVASRAAAQEPNRSVSADAGVAVTSSTEAPALSDGAATSARASSSSGTQPSSVEKAAIESELRTEGEQRFRTNCGRCHMPPHKFPPRVMATAIRHMRVRAMLTDEDMRLILHYMTQ
jgi:mono/diheme cytochrome c family protein